MLPGRRADQYERPPGVGEAARGAGFPSSNLVNARRVVVFGATGGIFVYNGTPALGNLIGTITPGAGTDPYGNAYVGGVTSYIPGLDLVSLIGGSVVFDGLQPASTSIGGALIQFTDSVAAATRPQLHLNTPPTTPLGNQATLNLMGESQDHTAQPQAVLSGGNAGVPVPVTTSLLEVQGGLAVGRTAGKFREWYVPLGTSADTTAINTALAAGFDVDIGPGVVGVNATLALAGHQELRGSPGAILTALAALAGGITSISGTNNRIQGMQFAGGGFNADAVQVAAGANRWYVTDIIAQTVQGLIVNIPGSTGAMHGIISGVLGTGCNGGIAAVFGGGSSTLELAIAKCNIQSCQSAPVLDIEGVTDVRVDDLNGSVITNSGVPGVKIAGNCQALFLAGLDIGGDKNAAGVGVLDIGSSGSSNEIAVSDSVLQDGNIGVVVAGTTARMRFSAVMAKRSQGDGWLWSGTGAFNQMDICAGNLNNQSGGGGYDIDVTSTAHLLIDGFAYVSGAVTASLNVAVAGNHVTEVNPPAGRTTAGFAPAGW